MHWIVLMNKPSSMVGIEVTSHMNPTLEECSKSENLKCDYGSVMNPTLEKCSKSEHLKRDFGSVGLYL
jgi:hypothetical protein